MPLAHIARGQIADRPRLAFVCRCLWDPLTRALQIIGLTEKHRACVLFRFRFCSWYWYCLCRVLSLTSTIFGSGSGHSGGHPASPSAYSAAKHNPAAGSDHTTRVIGDTPWRGAYSSQRRGQQQPIHHQGPDQTRGRGHRRGGRAEGRAENISSSSDTPVRVCFFPGAWLFPLMLERSNLWLGRFATHIDIRESLD